MTGFNHICPIGNNLYVSMVIHLILSQSLVKYLRGLFFDPYLFIYLFIL